MAIKPSFYAICDICGSKEFANGKTGAAARRDAEGQGWHFWARGARCMCDRCNRGLAFHKGDKVVWRETDGTVNGHVVKTVKQGTVIDYSLGKRTSNAKILFVISVRTPRMVWEVRHLAAHKLTHANDPDGIPTEWGEDQPDDDRQDEHAHAY